jgi:hypothetical protein
MLDTGLNTACPLRPQGKNGIQWKNLRKREDMVSLAWNAPQNINFRCAHMEPMPLNHGATPGLGHLHRGASNPQIAYDKEFAKTFISPRREIPNPLTNL